MAASGYKANIRTNFYTQFSCWKNFKFAKYDTFKVTGNGANATKVVKANVEIFFCFDFCASDLVLSPTFLVTLKLGNLTNRHQKF